MTASQVDQPLTLLASAAMKPEAMKRLAILHKEGKYEEGWQYANDLLKQYPNNTEIMGFTILFAKQLNKKSIAMAFGLNQLQKHPNDFYLMYQLGMVYYENYSFESAFSLINKALAMDKNNFLIGGNLAVINFEHGNLDAAISAYQHQLDIHTTDPKIAFGQALAWLAKRDYKLGWEAYEQRFLLKEPDCRPIKLPSPLWNGITDIRGKRLLVTWEQGLGDNIQFIRFMPLLKQKTQATIIHACLPLLTRLFQSVPGIDLLVDNMPLPEHDYQMSIQSVPYLLKLYSDEQLLPMPYLHADPALISQWSKKIDNHRIKVGLCWAGGKAYMHDTKRNSGLHYFLELFGNPRIQLYSLQKPINNEDKLILDAGHVADFSNDFIDFAETAAAISLLDIVITVDTSIAHLAAALGKPTFVLIRYETEWRHPRDCDISPWYASMRLFRQHYPGSWHACIKDVINALNQFVNNYTPITINNSQNTALPVLNVETTTKPSVSIQFPGFANRITEMEMQKINQLYLDNQFEASLKFAKACFKRDPSCLGALVSIARAATSLNQESLALGILLRRLKEEPNNHLTHYLLSLTYKKLRQYDKSLHHAKICVKLDKMNPVYLEAVAKNYYDLRNNKKAYDFYKKINSIQPTNETSINISLTLLAERKYKEGWLLYEKRFGLPIFNKEYVQSMMPYWDGHKDIQGKRLLLIWEQGIGDVIQFMRFIPLLKEKTKAHIIFVCGTAMTSISKRFPGVDETHSALPLPSHDYKIYLQSLPLLLEIFHENQFLSKPYIKANEQLISKWKEKLYNLKKHNIGICWKGGNRYSYNNERNCELGYFLSLIKADYQLVNLQKDLTKAEQEILAYTPIMNIENELTSIEETAAVISHLDLVITVDTAVAHLAGAVGKPVWTLIRYETEWRHPSDTDLSPWYPQMRLFRQAKPGDWDGVFKQVHQALMQYFTENKKEKDLA